MTGFVPGAVARREAVGLLVTVLICSRRDWLHDGRKYGCMVGFLLCGCGMGCLWGLRGMSAWLVDS